MPEETGEEIPTVIVSQLDRLGGYSFELNIDGRKIPFPFDPEKGTLTIGRSLDSKIQILAKTVSRTHAELKYNPVGRECLLGDKGSLNGTYVNGERLKKDKYRVLGDGDLVRFGNAQLQFRENLR